MIIEVNFPVFSVKKNDPTNVVYKKPENTKDSDYYTFVVKTFMKGFPELNEGDILYKYKEDRGYILTKENNMEKEKKTFNNLKVDDNVYIIQKDGFLIKEFVVGKIIEIKELEDNTKIFYYSTKNDKRVEFAMLDKNLDLSVYNYLVNIYIICDKDEVMKFIDKIKEEFNKKTYDFNTKIYLMYQEIENGN